MSEYIWSFLSFILSPTSPLNTFEYANGSPYRNLDFVLWLAPGLDLGHASLKAQVFHERLTLESMCETALYATPADDLNTCLLQLKSDQSSLRQVPLPTGDFVMRITTIPLPLYPPPHLLLYSSLNFDPSFGSCALIYSASPRLLLSPCSRSRSSCSFCVPRCHFARGYGGKKGSRVWDRWKWIQDTHDRGLQANIKYKACWEICLNQASLTHFGRSRFANLN